MAFFPKTRTHPSEIFPFPEQDAVVLENPPCLIWLSDKESENESYRVVLKDDKLWQEQYTTSKAFCILPEPLPPGKYTWNVYCGQRERGWQSFYLSESAVEFSRPTAREIYEAIPENIHPRALFEKKDIEQISVLRARELEVLKRNIQLALENAPLRPPYLQNTDAVVCYHHARDYIGIIREYADRDMIACALGWQLLADEQAGQKGKQLLLELASWDFDDRFVSAFPPYDEVGLSIARTLPAAFDLLYDLLTDDQRKMVVNAMGKMAQQCYQRIVQEDYESHPGNSHAGRLPAYLAEAAMMLKGYLPEETLMQYLSVATEIYGGSFPHYGSQDGGWGEGPFYAGSYTKWFLPFFLCVERYTGKSYLNRPFYQNLSNFFLHFADKDFENHPFGDGYWCSSEDREWPGFFAQDPFRIYGEKFGPQQAQEKQRAIPEPEIFRLHLMDIFVPRQLPPAHHCTRQASLAEAFSQTGVFSMRSCFETEDCLAVMGRASRFGSASHSHGDQGSFALFYEGVSLISPSGYYGAGWSSDHHQLWTKQSKAHNTILVDGEGMPAPSEKPVGKIESCRQEGKLFTACLNLDDAYASLSHWKRCFTMDAEAKTLIVEDEISSDQPHRLDWLLHSLSAPEAKDGVVVLERQGIRLTIQPLDGLPGQVEISDRFEPETDSGVLGNPKHYPAPRQFHMKWQTENALSHKIAVKFAVEKM